MKIYNDDKFSIFFGNSEISPFSGKEFLSLIENNKKSLQEKLLSKTKLLNKKLISNKFLFLKQIHSTQGLFLSKNSRISIQSFINEGDYIISIVKKLAIGVYTADCLPIMFYEPNNSIIAIAHAGWPGTIKNICFKVIQKMQKNYNFDIKKLKIFFGACAKVCCYEVSKDFIEKLNPDYIKETIIYKNDKLFFNLPLYNILLLKNVGILLKNINLSYNDCTICNMEYCSYRRDKEASGRQMTIITLK